MRETLSTALIAALVVLCAWAYPRLNEWTYRRRIRRDAAQVAQAADPSGRPADHRP